MEREELKELLEAGGAEGGSEDVVLGAHDALGEYDGDEGDYEEVSAGREVRLKGGFQPV